MELKLKLNIAIYYKKAKKSLTRIKMDDNIRLWLKKMDKKRGKEQKKQKNVK